MRAFVVYAVISLAPTDSVLSALRSCGCDVVQGFLLARPMEREQVEEWLRTTGPAAAAA